MRGANLEGAVLRDVVLSGVNLSDVDLEDADFRDADFRDAVLVVSSFCGEANRLVNYHVPTDEAFAGCFRESLEELEIAVIKKYGSLDNTNYKFFIEECKWARERYLKTRGEK